MAKLFKLNSRKMTKREKRNHRGDWYAKIRLEAYHYKRVRLCSDAEVSETWARLLQNAVDRKRANEPLDMDKLRDIPKRCLGTLELISELAKRRTARFSTHVEDYIKDLETAGRDAAYVYNIKNILTEVESACQWSTLADVDRDSFLAWRQERAEAGTGSRTLNNYTNIVRGFIRWCIDGKRMDENPLQSVTRIDETGDRRRKRRGLCNAECRRLLVVAGPRKLVYETALGTGLRHKELRQLQWRDVRCDDRNRAYVHLREEGTKSKRSDILPLHPSLARKLVQSRPADAAPTDPVFASVPKWATFCKDLKRAGIEQVDSEGQIVGFHSLRVTYISDVQRAGLTPTEVMQLSRHKDWKTTLESYTDLKLIDVYSAVKKLPTYDHDPEIQAAAKTGTYGTGSEPDQILDQKGGISGPRTASDDTVKQLSKVLDSGEGDRREHPEVEPGDSVRRQKASPDINSRKASASGTRSWGTRIRT